MSNSLTAHLNGTHLLMAKLMYGSGLGLMEFIRLRFKNLDFDRNIIYVRVAKGNKDGMYVPR
ncbi:MAG: tyrosine-type recombinase/integrase [Deltaproteobacteria bacterium]|nr:tyrosine-type recombinase/integrase [Deltaproteobacteria bacterium]